MADKKIVKVSRQAVQLAQLHVEAARRAGRKPDAGVARIATARPENGNGNGVAPAPA